MPETKTTNKRPLLISIVVVIGIVGGVLALPIAFSGTAKEVGSWYPPFLALFIFLGFICHVGFWMMKRWAVFMYVLMIVSAQIVLFSMSIWNPYSLIEPAIVIVIVMKYFEIME